MVQQVHSLCYVMEVKCIVVSLCTFIASSCDEIAAASNDHICT